MHASGVTIYDVLMHKANNQNTGGYIEKIGTALYVRTEVLIGSKSDI
ncbi:MAG: hypothetical protein IPN46_15095 [Saprospiraceae bacterium]|nr:hypothetical protein [Saprospiraceae bacterium]